MTTAALPCFVAGHLTLISASNFNTHTASCVDILFVNNFMLTVLLPTQITQNTSLLGDYIYYYAGSKPFFCMSGFFLYYSIITYSCK